MNAIGRVLSLLAMAMIITTAPCAYAQTGSEETEAQRRFRINEEECTTAMDRFLANRHLEAAEHNVPIEFTVVLEDGREVPVTEVEFREIGIVQCQMDRASDDPVLAPLLRQTLQPESPT